MSHSQSAGGVEGSVVKESRPPVAAFIFGVPLAVGVLWLFNFGPLSQSEARRYVSHAVEWVEVLLFCCAVAALGAKLLRSGTERRACRRELLPPWDGRPLPVAEAGPLLSRLGQVPRRLQGTVVYQRVAAVLDFVRRRGSANELDDQLRALADNDSLALEGSYALTRFITWAIPILGFLGTVLGITQSINGITPEVLEKDLSKVTDGLALAFDCTALGLGLTMVTMFLSFLVERAEQGILDTVDRLADSQLAHRFERTGTPAGDASGMAHVAEQLVQRQAALWARAFEEAERRRAGLEGQHIERLTRALEAALERTQEAHTRRLAALEKQVLDHGAGLIERITAQAAAFTTATRDQQAALTRVADGVSAQAQVLARLQEGEKHLLRLQEAFHQNLTALAGAGTFEQAVHNLTAAIHLLTARSSGVAAASSAGPARASGPVKGAAA
jgi:biopolymer transport protein ExbB/TolQ